MAKKTDRKDIYKVGKNFTVYTKRKWQGAIISTAFKLAGFKASRSAWSANDKMYQIFIYPKG